jgi:hypothetical protein
MRFRFVKIHLLHNELLLPQEKDLTETGFSTPEDLGENIYGWNVSIATTMHNADKSQALFIETASEFQFASEGPFNDEFNRGDHFGIICELVYAAHCHHQAVFLSCANEYGGFDDVVPRFCTLQEVKTSTEDALKNAKTS